jgi:hypothetical protein
MRRWWRISTSFHAVLLDFSRFAARARWRMLRIGATAEKFTV